MASASLSATIDKYIGQTIAQLKFESEDPLDTGKLKNIVTVAPGQVLEPAALRESIRALYATREFSYIEVDAETLLGGLVITFRLRPNFFFADFRMGGDAVLRSPLSGLTQLPLGEVYSPKTVQDLLNKVQQAWLDHDVPQCGYCQAGMIMAVAALLRDKPQPTDADIDATITNICRCGTFQQVRAAIHAAARA